MQIWHECVEYDSALRTVGTALTRALGSIPSLSPLNCVVVHACDAGTQEVEAGGSDV